LRAKTITIRVPYKRFRPAEVPQQAAAEILRRLVMAGVSEPVVARWQEGRAAPQEAERGLSTEAKESRRLMSGELLKLQAEAVTAKVAALQGIVGEEARELELQAVALSKEIAVLAVPFELFSEVGMAIQNASPFAYLFLLTYSNDLGGYLMPDGEYARGGFETGITFYGPGAAEAVQTGALRVLHDLAAASA